MTVLSLSGRGNSLSVGVGGVGPRGGRRGPCRVEVTRDPCEARRVFPLFEFTGLPGVGVFDSIRFGVAVGGGWGCECVISWKVGVSLWGGLDRVGRWG